MFFDSTLPFFGDFDKALSAIIGILKAFNEIAFFKLRHYPGHPWRGDIANPQFTFRSQPRLWLL